MSLNHPVVVFGGGQMGGGLARFWSDNRIAGVHVVERDAARRADLSGSGLRCVAELSDAKLAKSVLVIAIKPQQFANLDAPTAQLIQQASLVISIMAGVPLSRLQEIHPHSVRVMPNLPAAIGAGMSVGFAPALDEPRKKAVTTLFSAAGKFLWLADETQLHAATAISGSGPAYVFRFLEALIASAIARGFDAKQARLLATQTLVGAAQQAAASPLDAGVLRAHVTSPGGTTEAALKLIADGFDTLLEAATSAAEKRSKALADESF